MASDLPRGRKEPFDRIERDIDVQLNPNEAPFRHPKRPRHVVRSNAPLRREEAGTRWGGFSERGALKCERFDVVKQTASRRIDSSKRKETSHAAARRSRTAMDLATYDPKLDRTSARGQMEETKKLVQQEQAMELRRSDAEKHLYSDVWTKDPHGGAYRQVGCREGYDALLESPDGSLKEVQPGYERPLTGPTTNFVGNHMTQGAIDLVQSELMQRDPTYQMQKIRNYQCTYRPPKLLEREVQFRKECGKVETVHSYSWRDLGEEIMLVVPVQEMTKDLAVAQVVPKFDEERFDLEIKCPDERTWRLSLWPLRHRVDPSKCRFKLGKGKIEVHLRKDNATQPWKELLNREQMSTPKLKQGTPTDVPTLAELRKAVRHQRDNKKPGDGLLYKLPPSIAASEEQSVQREDEGVPPLPASLTLEETLCLAKERFAMGSYVDCEVYCTWGLQLAPTEDVESRESLLLQRANARAHLGCAKKVVRDCTLSLEIAPGSVAAMMQRAKANEELECFEESLADLQQVVTLAPENTLALENRRRVRQLLESSLKLRAQEDRGDTSGSDLRPSIPRPVLPQFENRGKAGAVF